MSRLIIARSSALRMGTAHWKELSKIKTPTVSIGRRLSTTPMAASRASSIFLPSIEDDLSMISTTAVPSGDRGGATLAGGERSQKHPTAFVFVLRVVLAPAPHRHSA